MPHPDDYHARRAASSRFSARVVIANTLGMVILAALAVVLEMLR